MTSDVPRPGPPPGRLPNAPVPGPPPGRPVPGPPSDAPGPAPAPHGTDVAGPIAEAVRRLDRLDALPTARHVDAFEQVHTTLTDALSAIDGM
jgi:hypothetical protein